MAYKSITTVCSDYRINVMLTGIIFKPIAGIKYSHYPQVSKQEFIKPNESYSLDRYLLQVDFLF